MLTVSVAELAVMTAFVIVIAAGFVAGCTENDVPVRLTPVMLTVKPFCPASRYFGVIELMSGEATTVKFDADVAVVAPTVTETVPVVAVLGTTTESEVAEAAVTVAATPLNLTVLLAGVGLKPWPCMVIAEPGPA